MENNRFKKSLFIGYIIYIENPKNYTKVLSQLIGQWFKDTVFIVSKKNAPFKY